MTRVAFADATRLALDWLAARLTAEGLSVPTHGQVPSTRPATFVVARRVGGELETPVTDAAMIAVDCWAATRPGAQDLAQTCRSMLHAAEGEQIDGTWVYRVRDVAAPADLPDPLSDQPRFTFTVQIVTRGRTVTT